jgi:D-alanine-D-alanine ligase
MRRVIVLGGGISPEREVSLRSSREVVNALQACGYNTVFIDPKVSKDYLSPKPGDIVFPVLHGEFGEDGQVQKELEERRIPFLGSGSKASLLSFDKSLTRKELAKHGIPIARGDTVRRDNYQSHSLAASPHVLKAVNGGSSIGTLIVRDPGEVTQQKIDDVFDMSDTAVIEELVEGVEITVPILDNSALPVIEIRPPANEEFDYANKYNGLSAEICPPETVSKEMQERAQRISEQAHTALGCRHLSRIDIIMRPDDSMVVLEINTIPGLTNQSLYPKSAMVAGLDFPNLARRFVELVERDYKLSDQMV